MKNIVGIDLDPRDRPYNVTHQQFLYHQYRLPTSFFHQRSGFFRIIQIVIFDIHVILILFQST